MYIYGHTCVLTSLFLHLKLGLIRAYLFYTFCETLIDKTALGCCIAEGTSCVPHSFGHGSWRKSPLPFKSNEYVQ